PSDAGPARPASESAARTRAPAETEVQRRLRTAQTSHSPQNGIPAARPELSNRVAAPGGVARAGPEPPPADHRRFRTGPLPRAAPSRAACAPDISPGDAGP